MRFFCPEPCPLPPPAERRRAYRAAEHLGGLRLGEDTLFYKSGGRVAALPYGRLERYFRRVMLVPVRLCCGKGTLPVEHLVLCAAGRELAVVALPSRRAAEAAMERLRQLAPAAAAGKPA